jgi:hypothetical protein
MVARVALLLVVVALAAPAAATAQFGPIPSSQPETTEAPAPSNNTPEDDGLSRRSEILIFGGGIAFIIAIGWLIVRDARSRAPVEPRGPERTAATHSPKRQARNRAKAKAARAQRKRNRARR